MKHKQGINSAVQAVVNGVVEASPCAIFFLFPLNNKEDRLDCNHTASVNSLCLLDSLHVHQEISDLL